MRLIDADAAIDALETVKTVKAENGELYIAKINAQMKLETLPSIRPEPKTGHWVYRPEWSKYSDVWSCSECGEKTSQSVMGEPRFKYCPMCGAKMEGGEQE